MKAHMKHKRAQSEIIPLPPQPPDLGRRRRTVLIFPVFLLFSLWGVIPMQGGAPKEGKGEKVALYDH